MVHPMTLGEAVGLLVAAYIDKRSISLEERRAILKILPFECRYIENGSHEILALVTLQAVMDYQEEKPSSKGLI